MARRVSSDKQSYGLGFTSNPLAAGISPANATTYYFPLGLWVGAFALTTQGAFQPPVPRPGVIRNLDVSVLNGAVNGSNETVTFKVAVNGGTPVTLGTTTFDQGVSTYRKLSYSGLGVAVAEGDYVELQMLTPTWGTRPTGCFIHANAFVEAR